MALGLGLGALALGAGADETGTFHGEAPDVAVRYYAGGIGHSAARQAAEQSREYSVRVLFAAPDRSFLANVGLTVTDARGRVVFRIARAGPLILLGLPPGSYAFEGSYKGASRRVEPVAVRPGPRRDVVFVFPE